MLVLLLSAVVVGLTSTAQLLLKVGAVRGEGHRLINGYVITGYVLFLVVVAASYELMQVLDMKYFTTLMSANYVAVALASRILLKERFGRQRALGTALIALGIWAFVTS
jgi:drug/metabolite transporter (DMT)-like permease